MKPIEFEGHNKVYAKDQPQYQPLPVFKAETPEGECVSCWQLSFKERMRILWTGKLWLSMMTFNKPLTPVFPTTKMEDVFTLNK